jgi:hypothetical protein
MPRMQSWIGSGLADGLDGEDESWLNSPELDALEVTEGVNFAHPEHSWMEGMPPLEYPFGAEHGHRVPSKNAAETALARTLAAAGHADADADADAVNQATGGDPSAMAAVTRGVRVAHVARRKRKGDVDLHGIVAKRASKHAARFKSIHTKHKHARDEAERKLAHHLEKKGHKRRKAHALAHLARHATGGDRRAMAALTAAAATAPGGAAFNLGNVFGQVNPGLSAYFTRLAMMHGYSLAPPAPPTGWFGGGAGPQGDTLGPGATLASGQSMLSNQNSTKLRMNSNGSVDVLDPTRHDKTMWHITESSGHPGATLVMGTDGALVVKDKGGATLWSSANSTDTKSSPVPGAYLLVQNDGNIVVYDPSGNALWNPNLSKNFRRHPQPAPNASTTQTLPDGFASGTQPMSDANWNDTDGDGASAAPPAPPDGSDGSDASPAPPDASSDGSSDGSSGDGSDASAQAAPAPPTDGSSDASAEPAPPTDGSAVSGDSWGHEDMMLDDDYSPWGLRA